MTQSPQSPKLPIETDVASVATWQANDDDILLFDVRELSEHETARIAGSVLIPMSELGDRWSELESYRDRLIVVLCHHGY